MARTFYGLWRTKATRYSCLGSLVAALLFLLKFSSSGVDVHGSVVEPCVYEQVAKPYPYPYDRHHWFKLLQSDAQRKPPSWIHALVSAAQPDKVPTLQRIYARSSFLLVEDAISNGQAHDGNLARLRLTLENSCQLFSWLNSTFPHAEHKFLNDGTSASESTFFSACLSDHMLHDDPDLVFLEFDINDCSPQYKDREGQRYLDNVRRRGMETLIRQVLQLRSRPAVLYLHIWVPGHNNGQFWGSTVEDEIEVLVKYYGIQSISMRNAIFDKFLTKKVGYRENDIACNAVHPNYLYHRYMADLIIGFLQDQMGRLLADPVSSEELASLRRPLLQPMLPRNSEKHVPCLNGASLKRAALQNTVGHNGDLFMQMPGSVDKLALVCPSVHCLFAWMFVKLGGWPKSLRIDALMQAHMRSRPLDMVDTTRHVHAPEGEGIPEVMLGVSYFKGWSNDGWGSATLKCDPRCQCEPDRISFTAGWRWRDSQYRWAFLPAASTRDCVIQISNVSPSGTAPKVAIYSITVLPGNRTFGAMMSVYAQNIPDE